MKSKYNIGDEVYWNDPDDGACSGYYIVEDIIIPDFGLEDSIIYKLKSLDGTVIEAFEFELS